MHAIQMLSFWLCINFYFMFCYGYYLEKSEEFFRVDGGKEEWGYVNVRPAAYMFYWLYYTQAPEGYTKVPLVMWLQGGPGASSTGYGNFEEIGPLDVKQSARSTTWLKETSILFVDNPVGTGFSYVLKDDAYATNNDMIANDMVNFLTTFFMDSKAGKSFQNIPFFIFSESYGGKMTAAISDKLYQAIGSKKIKCKFMGLAMGDSWIQPYLSTVNWAPYLLTNSLIDEYGNSKIEAANNVLKTLISKQEWKNATMQWSEIQTLVELYSNGVNFYNILQWGSSNNIKNQDIGYKENMYNRLVKPFHSDPLTDLMNGPVRAKLKIIPKTVVWGGQSGMVFTKLAEDFMKPVVTIVDKLIEKTDLSVVVYSGQLDLIVGTPGTEKWVETLKIYPKYFPAKRTALYDPNSKKTCGFEKSVDNFSFYWILNAGHMVPADNGNAALEMLKRITKPTTTLKFSPHVFSRP